MVAVPANAAAGTVDQTTVTAVSAADPSVTDTVIDTTTGQHTTYMTTGNVTHVMRTPVPVQHRPLVSSFKMPQAGQAAQQQQDTFIIAPQIITPQPPQQ